MFKSNKPVDPRKTWGKFLDFKRDGIARLKKLRSVIGKLLLLYWLLMIRL